MSLSNMTPEERNLKIFEAAIGCSGAAVEFLRSVNKPLNTTYIAQNAWEIAKKLEEMMETAIRRENETGRRTEPLLGTGIDPLPPKSNGHLELVPFGDPLPLK
jgi:hypothetical protein